MIDNKIHTANENSRDTGAEGKTGEPYQFPWEYLADCLTNLDLRIKQILSDTASHEQADTNYILEYNKILNLLVHVPLNNRLAGERLFFVNEINTRQRLRAAGEQGYVPPLSLLFELFSLEPLEQEIFLICLAPVIDPKYATIYAYIQDDSVKKYPTLNIIFLLLNATPEEKNRILDFFSFSATLRNWHFIDIADDNFYSNFLELPIGVDNRILPYIYGNTLLADFLQPAGRIAVNIFDSDNMPVGDELHNAIKNTFRTKEALSGHVIYYFKGYDALVKQYTAAAVCGQHGYRLLVVDVESLLQLPGTTEENFKKTIREAFLFRLVIFLDNVQALDNTEWVQIKHKLLDMLDSMQLPCFFSSPVAFSETHWPIFKPVKEFEFMLPDYSLRYQIWKQYLGEKCAPATIAELSTRFHLSFEQITRAISQTEPETGEKNFTDCLFSSCRKQCSHNLDAMAQKISYPFDFDDIILPADIKNQLREITAFYRCKAILFDDWKYKKKLPYGKGTTVLFSGPSGTGKTMAASILANTLGLDIYKIDLAFTISKYIGETEKNLHKIFSEAAHSNAVLFFDEADAIFGKRTEVKDAHDRYANIETSYLLQLVEEYEGMSILATNLRDNIDDAFMRRIKFLIEFPFPEESQRRKIWEISFPGSAPLEKGIDYDFLAKKIKLAGGNIKSIALMAGMFALQENTGIGMRHILFGVRREYQRYGKRFLKADFLPYYDLISKEVEP